MARPKISRNVVVPSAPKAALVADALRELGIVSHKALVKIQLTVSTGQVRNSDGSPHTFTEPLGEEDRRPERRVERGRVPSSLRLLQEDQHRWYPLVGVSASTVEIVGPQNSDP